MNNVGGDHGQQNFGDIPGSKIWVLVFSLLSWLIKLNNGNGFVIHEFNVGV